RDFPEASAAVIVQVGSMLECFLCFCEMAEVFFSTSQAIPCPRGVWMLAEGASRKFHDAVPVLFAFGLVPLCGARLETRSALLLCEERKTREDGNRRCKECCRTRTYYVAMRHT